MAVRLPPLLAAGLFAVSFAVGARAAEAEKFELRDGDMVAFVGNTFVEREQAHSYLETLLASRWPERNVRFRNLGWSGDTVFGDARAGFDKAPQGFDRLIGRVREVKPTVLLVSYGMNESFEGPGKLTEFRQGYERLLDRLDEFKARVVLISPIRHEHLGPPLPDPAEHNRHLRQYIDTTKEIAERRGYRFIDLYQLLDDDTRANRGRSVTTNGIHLSPYGYWRAAGAIERGLGLPFRGWTIQVDASQGGSNVEGVKVSDVKTGDTGLSFRTEGERLPPPPAPSAGHGQTLPGSQRIVRVTGLPPGRYVLKADGTPLMTGTERQWATGIEISRDDPMSGRAEALREAAAAKNVQFFNKWRPQNETYIFGFRKHEQGRNAAEMPQFDPHIAEKEAEMAKLRAGGDRTYVLEKAP